MVFRRGERRLILRKDLPELERRTAIHRTVEFRAAQLRCLGVVQPTRVVNAYQIANLGDRAVSLKQLTHAEPGYDLDGFDTLDADVGRIRRYGLDLGGGVVTTTGKQCRGRGNQ